MPAPPEGQVGLDHLGHVAVDRELAGRSHHLQVGQEADRHRDQEGPRPAGAHGPVGAVLGAA